MKKKDTSWGRVAKWYDSLIEKEASNYQKDIVLPNLVRLMNPQKGDSILDLACGQGFFSKEFARKGAKVIGADIAAELIELAKTSSKKENLKIDFHVSSADNLSFVDSASIDKVSVVLAIQNIENLNGVLSEISRVLRPNGNAFIVMNHPAYRIPKRSSWGWDPVKPDKSGHGASEGVQYRRVDEYMSESKSEIQMHPGVKPTEVTISFHRPLQLYFKAFKKTGLAVVGLEEWISKKRSEPGPRAKAEDKSRKEIPLFMLLELQKINSR